tara:strand:- start:1377 stop:1535 length:159 start_codon:yes stop_codon:yes gene_type:complete
VWSIVTFKTAAPQITPRGFALELQVNAALTEDSPQVLTTILMRQQDVIFFFR